ncbi:MAG: calcium-binding protein, partial [Nocardioides sp.]
TPLTAVSPAAAYQPPTALLGDGGTPIPLKNAAMIVMTEGGFRYIAGQQNSHLTATMADGKLRLEDTGTEELRDIPRRCQRQTVRDGIAALCTIPARFVDTMYLEVWPRLGNDFVDGSTLPSMVRFWVLADAGFDTVYGGAGDDFVNGAQDDDKVWGGAGDDWIRTGIGNDELWGDSGDDKLVGTDGHDVLHGGDGDDRVYGGAHRDQLHADAGVDVVSCGGGRDGAWYDRLDRVRDCETRTVS